MTNFWDLLWSQRSSPSLLPLAPPSNRERERGVSEARKRRERNGEKIEKRQRGERKGEERGVGERRERERLRVSNKIGYLI